MVEFKRLAQEGWKALFHALFEHSSEALFVLDSAGRVLDLNRQASESLGCSREELIGKCPVEFDTCWQQENPRGFDASPGCSTVSFQTRHRRKDGTEFPVKARVVPIGHEGQRFALFFARDLSERQSAEDALQASEERFRTLVKLSFDVYWETDAEHRFTRQEFSPRLAEAPTRGSELGKKRWEVPYLEPDEEAWREHRATVAAHLPFSDFELARPTPGGGRRYVSVSGFPVYDRSGKFLGYRGVGRHITQLKRVQAEHRAHLWFLESMDRINRAMHAGQDLEGIAGEVLEAVVEIVACDRAWLIQACDPQVATWRAVVERTRPHCPAAFDSRTQSATDPHMAAVFAAARSSSEPVLLLPPALAERFAARAQMALALQPKGAQPYLLGLHQCSHARTWTEDEQRLFREIGGRLTDALTGVLAFSRLAESEGRLEAAQRIAAVGWWERDFLTGQLSLSDESCRIFGVQPLNLPQWHGQWLSLIHPEDRDQAAAAAQAALAGGPRYDVEYRIVRPDGTLRVVHSQGDVTRDESGRPLRQFGVMQDITKLRQAEQAMRESEQRYRTLFEKANDAIFLENEHGQIIEANERACTLFGYRQDELLGMKASALEAAQDGGPAGELVREQMARHGSINFEGVRLHRSGRPIPVEVTNTAIASGRENLVFSVVRDITERKRAEAQLRARQELLDLAQRAARAVAFDWYIGARESENYWSPELEAMYGLDPGTFDGTYQGWRKLLHPDDWPAVKAAIERANESGDVAAEYRVVHKDGSVHWLRARGRMFFAAPGQPERMVGFMFDVTDSRHAQEALRASEARFRTFVDRATDAFFLLDEQLIVVDVNRRACEALGYSREELVGMHPRQFDANLDERSIELVAARAAAETITFETCHRRRDGSVFPVEISSGTFKRGEQMLYLALARDISERKLAEQTVRAKDQALQAVRAELARVSRVTTLGELTASIAHEVNQPLAAMVANAAATKRWLAADPPQTEKARRALQSIADDGRRAGEVIQRIRALVQRRPARMSPVSVNDAVADVIALAQQELRSNGVVLSRLLSEDLPSVLGDRIQLQQVLLNLVVNAIEAMSAVKDRPRELTIASRLDEPGGVLVEVRDTGPGLEHEHADHLFEAFYTTKSEGLGIGLSISRSIIEAHGGRLSAAQNVPHGAIFRFTLPVQGAASA